tara:strand:+ start:46953 stop:47948 length:996 start_codon:yes stop_codon:yes gene_type:complete
MNSKIRWTLPDGVDELLPPRAIKVEGLRRDLIDLYISEGYQFIIPPLIELSETLGGEAHEELSSYAFSFKDDLTGKELSIRPDISEQASRIDAYRIPSENEVKLCYAGDVVKKKRPQVLRSRTTIQVGAEIFGAAGITAELESIQLMVKSLNKVGLSSITVNLGHAGFMNQVRNVIQNNINLDWTKIDKAISQKSQTDMLSLLPDKTEPWIEDILMNLCELYGDQTILEKAKNVFGSLEDSVLEPIEHLNNVTKKLNLDQETKLHFDLGELHGFKYHTGIVFSAYNDEAGYSLAKGGRYDGLRKSKNSARPAVGFDLDLLAVENLLEKTKG